MDWLRANEPTCYSVLDKKRDDVLDFRVIKHFAHSSGKLYSNDRWAVTGESGVFLDPFYSPGTDFIALNNTFLSDLILRNLSGEDIQARVNIYERTHFALFENWVPIYRNMYPLWGLTQTMVLKIFWDWATYWSVPTLLFTNEGYTNILVLRDLFASEGSVGQRFGELNGKIQELFIGWAKYDDGVFTEKYIDPFDVGYLQEFHRGIDERFDSKGLVEKVKQNLGVLEEIACKIYLLMCNKIYGTPVDIRVDPYNLSLGSPPTDQPNKTVISEQISREVQVMWYYPLKN